jgi:hypothetical protein
MKEIRLQDLLNMADAAAHDEISDLWNQKTIHFLVVFTSPDQDFEIIGAGPTLPCPTLEAAEAHLISNKKPEFYVKCPAAIASRLQPRLAPTLPRPVTRSPIPILKGRTITPFVRPPLDPSANTTNTAPSVSSSEVTIPAQTTESAIVPHPPAASPSTPAPSAAEQAKPATSPSLEEREHAIARREHELGVLAASLKIREAALRDREAAVIAREENLLKPPPKTD